MASHVILIDSRARQTRIATTPTTHLSDVLSQGCKKLGLDPTLFVLKHNDKTVDLSRSIQQTGLPSGAKLQLVQGSRSPAVITVAVQIPHMESTRRVTEKVPSSHSIWQILRLFETKEKLNFTQRGTGSFDSSDASSGSGRLYYEMPVVNVLNRELSTLADLQKTLSQLGITSGNVLMRLSFKATKQPLEEAMAGITQYFKDDTIAPAPTTTSNDTPAAATAVGVPVQEIAQQDKDITMNDSAEPSTANPSTVNSASPSTQVDNASNNAQPSLNPSIIVYSAPTTTATSRVVHNEADYIPTTEHAAVHQARLQESSRNGRLPSDAELAAKSQEQEAKLAAVGSVEVRIRFPDQTQIKSNFTRESETSSTSAHAVYEAVRSQMARPNLKFAIRYVDSKGQHVVLPDDAEFDIIKNAGWRGRVLANMEWDASVPASARTGPVLTAQALQQAQALPVPSSDNSENSKDADGKKGGLLGNLLQKAGGSKSEMSGAEKEDKLKKLLRFGKK